MRYFLDFGAANAGGSPSFSLYKRSDSLADLTPPAVTEVGSGIYYFDVDWSSVGVDTITYKSTLNGTELAGVISGTAPQGQAVGSVAAGSSTSGYDTAKSIINKAAVQLGILDGLSSTLPDPFASSDPNVQQLIEFLNYLGDDLNNKHDWTQFIKVATITTDGTSTVYNLPDDFHEYFDQSGWNNSTRLPLVGPISSEERRFLNVWLSGVILNVVFDLRGNQITFPVRPPANQTITFEYLSDRWIQTSGSSTVDAKESTAATDTICYDPGLMVVGVKLLWSELKGFDTALLHERYNAKLEHAIGKNYGGRVLKMGGRGIATDRFLDLNNIPITGFG